MRVWLFGEVGRKAVSVTWSHRWAFAVILAICWMIGPTAPSSAEADAAKETAEEPATGAGNEEAAGEDEAAAENETEDTGDTDEADDAFSDEELEDLVARIALYPDPLLAQILIASTEPVDVVRAARWTKDNEKLDGDERAAALEDEDWDPSVKTLTAFPSVLKTMSDDLEWTESLGDAFVAQSDDVLDAIQVMRAQAQAAGSLQTTDQQQVTVENDAISIEPAEPEVINVPQYDPRAVYEPASAFAPGAVPAAYPAASEVYPPTTVVGDSGFSTGAMLATGALSFGAGILVSELFDDDDDDWDDHFDWDDHEVYRGGGGRNVNVGDVNIDRSVNVEGGAWKPNKQQKADARKRVERKKANLDGKVPARQPRGDRQTKDVSRVEKKLAARGHDRDSVKRGAATTGGKTAAKPSVNKNKDGAFEGKKSAPKVKKDRQRGAASVRKSKGGTGKASSVKQASHASKGSKASRASKPHKNKTAFSGSHNGKSAKAAQKRGNKSANARQRGRGQKDRGRQ